MNTTSNVFRRAVSQLLTEIFEGPPEDWVYLLNPGDPGLLGQLDIIDAELASKRPAPGRTTIAAQVNHIRYSLALLNRWAAGEENPWTNADWEGSWERTRVTEDEWRTLREDLRREATSWRHAVDAREDWSGVTPETVLSSAVHTAYHLGALRQILLFLKDKNES